MLLTTRMTLLTLALAAPAGDKPAAEALPEHATARLGSLRWRTGSPAELVAYLPDGKSLLTVNDEWVAQVWDAADGTEKVSFAVTGAAAGNARRPRVYAVAVCVGAGGKTLAAYGHDGVVRLFDTSTGKEVRKIEVGRDGSGGTPLVALSGDGKRLAASVGVSISLWDSTTGKNIGSLANKGADENFEADKLAFTPDGKEVIQFGTWYGPNDSRTRIVIWDVKAMKESRRVEGRPDDSVGTTATSVVSADGGVVAIPAAEGVRLVSLADGKPGHLLRVPEADSGGDGVMAFTPDGKRLVFLGGGIESLVTFEVGTGKVLSRTQVALPRAVSRFLGAQGVTLAISPDGKTAAQGRGSVVWQVDLATGRTREEDGHCGSVLGLAFGLDGKSLCTVGVDGIRRWDVGKGTTTSRLDSATARLSTPSVARLSPDAKLLAVPEPRGGVRLLDTETGKETRTVASGQRVPSASVLAYSADARTLVLASSRSQTPALHLIDLVEGKRKLTIDLPGRGPAPGGFGGGRATGFRMAQLSPDGRFLLSAPGTRDAVRVYETEQGKVMHSLSLPANAAVRQATFGPDGRAVALDLYDGSVAVYEMAVGTVRATLGKPDPGLAERPGGRNVRLPSSAPTLSWSPDGRLVARAEGKTVRLFDARTGEALAEYAGHRGEVLCVQFSVDGKALASGSADTTALVWDVTAARKKLAAAGRPLAKERLEACWKDLLEADAKKAFAAARDLAGDVKQTTALMKDRLKPVEGITAKQIAALIADLDSDEFAVRSKARQALEDVGEAAAPALREALKDSPSAEVRKAAEDVLAVLKPSQPAGEALRAVRALEVLEWIGTAEAVESIRAMADAPAGTLPTQHAKAALKRLGQ